MLNFRKVLLAAAVTSLGLVSTASAQVSCTGWHLTTGSGLLHAEGMTEQLPSLTLDGCTGNTTGTITLMVTTNAPNANLALTGSTFGGSVDAIAVPTNLTGSAAQALGTASANSVTFSLTNTTGTATATTSIAISNLRVNVSAMAVGSNVTASLSALSSLTFGANFVSTITVATTQSSLSTSTFKTFTSVALCSVTAKDVNAVGVVQLGDNFAIPSNAGFNTALEEYTKESGIAGGYLTTTVGTANPLVSGGAPGNALGTRLAITFSNLATAGVNYYLPTSVTNGALTLTLVSSQTGTAVAGGSIGGSTTAGGSNIGASATVANVYGFTPVAGAFTAYYAVTADSNGAALDTTGAIPAAATGLTAAHLVLYETVPTVATVVASTAQPAVTVVLVGNTSNYAQYLAPATPTVVTQKSGGLLSTCSTTLLFPFVLNTNGYDTGLDLINASVGTTVTSTISQTATLASSGLITTGGVGAGGTFTIPAENITLPANGQQGSNTVVGQNGNCTLSLYGTVNGTATPAAGLVIKPTGTAGDPLTLTAGQNGLFLLSQVGGGVAAGFQGYMVASCTFQQAHGYALQVPAAGSTSQSGNSNGYIAVVIQDVFGGASVGLNPAQ